MLSKTFRTTALFLMAFTAVFSCSSRITAQGSLDLRTPKPSNAPRINGPSLYGAKPGHPFIYRIPSTGSRPMQFSIKNLPKGLTLDSHTGIITGQSPAARGTYVLSIEARNQDGKTKRNFSLVVGDTLGLTPQMGWNDWYTLYWNVTDKDIRAAADAMISSGMADFGYQFVDIDDTWGSKPGPNARDKAGNIIPNEKFPDMRALTDYIHSQGLRAGIYSSPGPLTCVSYTGSYEHEALDASQVARWGFDLLKYDLCSYRRVMKDLKSVSEVQQPYMKMGSLLQQQDRDIVFNLCEYGWGEVWKWGRDVHASSWRTTGDVGAMKGGALPGFYQAGFANAKLDAYAGPGAWNDPDYLMIGSAGDRHNLSAPPQPTHLTAAEQYSYMSMWSLMASPLFFSGDMAHLDPLTLSVLENSEVIDVDQDPLGKQAKVLRHTDNEFVLAKPMADGTIAVGLFNIGSQPRSIILDLHELKINKPSSVRDVWRQKNVGTFSEKYSVDVPSHDVMLIRISEMGIPTRSTKR